MKKLKGSEAGNIRRDRADRAGGDRGLRPGVRVPHRGPGDHRPGSEVSGSSLGPFTSVGPDCVIDASEIEYSIVLRGVSIRGLRRIEASLIGQEAAVTPAPAVRQAHRLVLADNSNVRISP